MQIRLPVAFGVNASVHVLRHALSPGVQCLRLLCLYSHIVLVTTLDV